MTMTSDRLAVHARYLRTLALMSPVTPAENRDPLTGDLVARQTSRPTLR